MTPTQFINIYVKDFRILENDFLSTDLYVSIDKKNYKTFSPKYMQLPLSICSSIDSLAGEFCCDLDGTAITECKYTSILQKYTTIHQKFYHSLPYKVVQFTFDAQIICIHPFTKFTDNSVSDWWRDYNEVKHQRSALTEGTNGNMHNYELANLKNVIHSLSAYYLLLSIINEYYLSKMEKVFQIESKVFSRPLKIS